MNNMKILFRMLSYLFFMVIVLVALTIASLNAERVLFNYYIGAKEISLSLLLIYTLGIGMIMGMMLILYPCIKIKREEHNLRMKFKEMEKESQNIE